MHAFRAEAGKIFVPCIRFGVQSGDFGYIACEYCQGGGIFASRASESCIGRESCRAFLCRGARNHTWRANIASTWCCVGLFVPAGRIRARAVREEGMCMRHAHALHQPPLDMKKAPESAFFIFYAICGVRRHQADFLQLIAARSQQKRAKGPVSRRLCEKSVEGHSLLAA